MSEVRVGGRGLVSALRSVIVHASTDEDLPGIARVFLDVVGDRLLVSATNRFTIGCAAVSLDEPDGDMWKAALLPADAKEITRLFKPGKDENPTLRLSTDPGQSEGGAGARFTVTDVSGLFEARSFTVPDIEADAHAHVALGLLARFTGAQPGGLGVPSFDAGLLALFDAAGREQGSPLVWTPTGPSSPVIVQCGEDFLGAIMPTRLSGDGVDAARRALDGWASLLPAPLPQAA